MLARHRKLRMEQMEARQLMAVTGAITTTGSLSISTTPPGDISAYVSNGSLFVNEASGYAHTDNGVRIIELPAAPQPPGVPPQHHIRVMGTGANNTTGHQSLVNGLAFQDFTVTGGLYM